ncbi:MAG TPA: acyltransferase domain-containing protein [Vicinamibacterales bacterium]|nr:acyltransferase domain-containing protein [Vicinamibacterales bacterium]
MLRRLADAQADGDHIYALIKGSAVNNDGSSKVGYLAPSVDGQAGAIAEALAVSGVEADDISYVETHGAGTPVGDPIEMAALTEAFRHSTARTGFCAVGSLKSNIGHLGEAAGIAGLIKTVLCLEHGQLPPTLHFRTPNPQIDFASSPFFVNDRLREWPRTATPRRAGVTSLGAGGTNCHVVLQEAPPAPAASASGAPQILVLSARTPAALAAASERLAAHLDAHPGLVLDDVAFTLQTGRKAFPHRRAVVCDSRAEAVAALGAETAPRGPAPDRPPALVFMFPGQGAQYPHMGRELYASEPAYRAALDLCDQHYRARCGTSLVDLICPPPGATTSLDDTAHTQPALFAVEYALAQQWLAWGVTPRAMIGHSLGEYSAACVAGVMSVADAMSLVIARGALMQSMPRGAMLSVAAPVAEVLAALAGTAVSLGASNAPEMSVVSGEEAEVAAFAAAAAARGWETKRLHISHASHSRMMDPILGPFGDAVRRVRLQPPAIPFVSNVTGTWIRAEEATDPDYWVRHLRSAVHFAEGIRTILADGPAVCLEVGPGRTLGMLSRQQPQPPAAVVQSLRHAKETTPDRVALRAAIGQLWTAGLPFEWTTLTGSSTRSRVALPTYPFERSYHWVAAPRHGAAAGAREIEGTTDKARDLADWFHVPVWVPTPREHAAPSARVLDGDVMVFADDGGIAAGAASAWLAQAARDDDAAVAVRPPRLYVVRRGAAFAQDSDTEFVVDPQRPRDYDALFSAVRGAGADVRHIVHAWTVGGDPGSHDGDGTGGGAAAVAATIDEAFAAPLALLQSVAGQELPHPLHVTFVTSGTADIAGETRLVPAKAALAGPCLVAPRELAGVTTRLVDVTPAASARQRDRLAALLAEELGTAGDDSAVAYRGATRYTRRFERHRLEAGAPSPLRERGVYLITGGSGALGLALAEHLATRVHARLVLVGRTTLPPRREWARLAADHATDPRLKHLAARLLACEAAGGEVLLAVADVTDADAVRGVVADTITAYGALHGVFHAAGTLDDVPLQAKTLAGARAVLDPKVLGAAALHAALAGRPLDFVVLYSSVSSVLGLRGQVDYTAANACLDAWAAAWSAETDTPVCAVGWGPWRDAGLAASAASGRRRPGGTPAVHPWLGTVSRRDGVTTFATILRREQDWVVGDHVVRGGEAVVPGTGYLELMRAAVAEARPGQVTLSNVFFEAPLFVPPGDGAAITIAVRAEGDTTTVTVSAGETRHASATAGDGPGQAASIDVAAIRARCTGRLLEPRGVLPQPFMDFGPRWANVERIRYGQGEALIELALPAAFAADLPQHALHPALLDMATGGAQFLIPGFVQETDFYIPFSYGRVRVHDALTAQVCSHVRLAEGTANGVATFAVTISDPAGRVLVEVTGFCLRRVATGLGAVAPVPVQTAAPPRGHAGTLADEMLRLGMDTAEGLEALERVLADDAGPQVFVSTGSLDAWRARVDAEMRVALPAARPAATGAAIAAHADFDEVERQIAGMWADLLGVTAVGPHDNFFDAGGHSLLGVRLLSRIEKAFGRGIPLGHLFEHATIRALAVLVRGPAGGPAAGPAAEADDEPVLARTSRDTLRVKRADLDPSRS